MDVGGIFTKVFTTVIVLSIFVAGIHYMVPLYKNIELQNLGRQYAGIIETHNGLSSSQTSQLEQEIKSRGFSNVSVVTNGATYGEMLILRIEADYPYREFLFLSSSEKILTMDYEKKIISRRVAF